MHISMSATRHNNLAKLHLLFGSYQVQHSWKLQGWNLICLLQIWSTQLSTIIFIYLFKTKLTIALSSYNWRDHDMIDINLDNTVKGTRMSNLKFNSFFCWVDDVHATVRMSHSNEQSRRWVSAFDGQHWSLLILSNF